MSHYFAEEIYNDVQQKEFLYPTLEFTGYPYKQKLELMKDIFNQDQMGLIRDKLGSSIYFLNIFTE